MRFQKLFRQMPNVLCISSFTRQVLTMLKSHILMFEAETNCAASGYRNSLVVQYEERALDIARPYPVEKKHAIMGGKQQGRRQSNPTEEAGERGKETTSCGGCISALYTLYIAVGRKV